MIESNVIRYGEDFKHSMEEGGWDLSKVDKKNWKNHRQRLYLSDERATGARARSFSGLTMAEYFAMAISKILLAVVTSCSFVDNIFRFTQAGSEVSALLGRMPSAVGYQPTLATEMVLMQERITSTKRGSITWYKRFMYLLMTWRSGSSNNFCAPWCYYSIES